MIKVGIVGGSGNAGSELIRLLLNHDNVELKIVVSESLKGKKIKQGLSYSSLDIVALNNMDVVFLAVPHGKSKEIANKLTCKVIDLTNEYRLTAPYGIPELFHKDIKNAKLVANPGCYATACILTTYPIKDIIKDVIFDCISGYTGAGKDAKKKLEIANNVIAYKLTDHFHISEIEQKLSLSIGFTPHMIDIPRGLMCTAHITLKKEIDVANIKKTYKHIYQNTFTKIVDHIPTIKEINKKTSCLIGGFEISGNKLVIVSVIDNLMKGAASQAVENMNIMFNMNHKEGLI